jgi:hypothetical protein
MLELMTNPRLPNPMFVQLDEACPDLRCLVCLSVKQICRSHAYMRRLQRALVAFPSTRVVRASTADDVSMYTHIGYGGG